MSAAGEHGCAHRSSDGHSLARAGSRPDPLPGVAGAGSLGGGERVPGQRLDLGAEAVRRRAGMFRTGLVDRVELALMSLVVAVAIRAAHGLHQSVCPVQAAPDKGSSLVKLGPAGDC